MKRATLLYVGACIILFVVVGLVAFFWNQNRSPETTFEVLPIATPQWDMTLSKPAAFMNVTVKNSGEVNQQNVVMKISGGFSNSTGQVPDELFLVTTKNIDTIRPGETVTISRIYDFGWYFFYRVEVSSSSVAKETFDQWVDWRSWTVPLPS